MKSLHDYRGEWRSAEKRTRKADNLWGRIFHKRGSGTREEQAAWRLWFSLKSRSSAKHEAYMRACDRILGPLTHLHIDVESGTITSARVKP